ncbi:MAG: hypothetical protein K2Q20_04390 [Phycisphaerales bacterium]|nr:hypothetical protein [Phycisphaerales bacterium]
MPHRSLIAISASVLCTAGGLALGRLWPELSTVSTAMVVLGGAGASVVLALAAAAMAGLSRVSPDTSIDAIARLDAFADELAAHAAVACDKGILLLGSARASRHEQLFSEGARMLVRAQLPAQMRTELSRLAEQELEDAHRRRKASLAACRTIPVVASAAALAGVLYLVVLVARAEPLGTLLPSAILLTVYAAFAVMLSAARAGERLQSIALEHELGTQLVIETLTRLREGDAPGRIRERLAGLLHPETVPVRRRRLSLSQAA